MSLKAVDKAIEQKAIRPIRRQGSVGIPVEEIAPLVVICRVGVPLPAQAKRKLRQWLIPEPGTSRELALSDALVVPTVLCPAVPVAELRAVGRCP